MKTTQQWQRLLELLKRDAYQKREVVLASGRTSNFYIDCRQVVLTAEGHFLTGWLFNAAIARLCPDVVAVGGMSMGADPLCSAASLMSYFHTRQLDALYVRKEAKKHGTTRLVEGGTKWSKGSAVSVLEDVVTTGQSTLDAIDRLQQAGFVPTYSIALVDRQEGGAEAIGERVPFFSIYKKSDLES